MSVTLLCLPREIRDEIYQAALVTDRSIIIWAGESIPRLVNEELTPSQASRPADLMWTLLVNYSATTISLHGLTLSLLQVSRLIAAEAAEIFYAKNSFSFLGAHNWHPIAPWMETIGARNRGYITKVIIEVGHLPNAYQLPNGVRVKMPYHPQTLYQRSRYLSLSHPAADGTVENINHPGIYCLFAALSSYTGPKRKVDLIVRLRAGLLPGVQLDIDETQPEWSWFTMDLPNVVEIIRAEHSLRSPDRVVDVIWEGMVTPRGFIEGRSLICEAGWSIVEEHDLIIPRPTQKAQDRWGPQLLKGFRLRRQAIPPGSLVTAGGCNPYLSKKPELLKQLSLYLDRII